MGASSLTGGCSHEEKKAGACKSAVIMATEMRLVAEETGWECVEEVRPEFFLRVMVFGSWSKGKARHWATRFQAS